MCLRYGRRGIIIRRLSSTSTTVQWDPTLSLQLNHPSLILLEKSKSRNQFKQILAQIMRSNLICNTFPMSRLITSSATSNPENLDMAVLLFKHFTPNPNLYIYNTMLSALSFSSCKSFAMYNSMMRSSISPGKNTLVYLVKSSKCLSELKQIHGHVIVTGLLFTLYQHDYLQNSIMKMYTKNGEMGLARKVFVDMPKPDITSFNIMILGYSRRQCNRNGFVNPGFELFYRMVGEFGYEPDGFTLLGLLVCCGETCDVRLGKSVHGWIERRGPAVSSSLILMNALVDMYVKCRNMKLASRVFDGMKEKDVVTWNTIVRGFANVGEMDVARAFFEKTPKKDVFSWNGLIAGYTRTGEYNIVRELVKNMVVERVTFDNVTMVSLVSGVAETGVLEQGKWAHGFALRTLRGEIDEFLSSALIDMYCKCGSIEKAFMVFESVTRKDVIDVIVWTTMITGFAFHGYGDKAIELFDSMRNPNKVTFVAVLTACSHSGYVDRGVEIFDSMKRSYGIEPEIEHYGCLVDLLTRSGRLVEAKDLIEKMPMRPSRSIWGAMLSACRVYGNVEMAKMALTELVELEPEKEGGYVLLSNVYAGIGKWSYSNEVREMMDNRGVKKSAGCSSVVVDGSVFDFVASDKTNRNWVDICFVLKHLHDEMKLGDDSFTRVIFRSLGDASVNQFTRKSSIV